MAFGVTTEGFNLKRLNDILADINTRLSSITDPITGEYLTPNLENVNDPLIQVVQITADAISVAWEMLQEAYNQFDPLKATGEGLTGLVQLNGLRRLQAAQSTVTLSITTSNPTTIPAGSKVSKQDGTGIFITLAPLVVTDSGTATNTVEAASMEYGPISANSGMLTKIVTPVTNWVSVTNGSAAAVGRYQETDTELRTRQQVSTETTGRSTLEDLYGALMNLSGVSFVRIYQNNTLTNPDTRGIPAKSVAPVIIGGTNSEIAAVMFRHLPLAVSSHGTTSVNVSDSLGGVHAMSFTRPAEVTVYIAAALVITDSSLWPSDGASQVTNAILTYVNSGAGALGLVSGFDQNGKVPGESVYASDFYVPILSIPGTKITSVFVGLTADPTSGSVVTIDWNKRAVFSAENIIIRVT